MEDMIKGLLTLYDIQGWLPDCHMSLGKGYTQGGSNADVLLADAFVKLNSSNIDWTKAYEAVVKDAEEEPYGTLFPALPHQVTSMLMYSQTGVAKDAAASIAGKHFITFPLKTSTTRATVPVLAPSHVLLNIPITTIASPS